MMFTKNDLLLCYLYSFNFITLYLILNYATTYEQKERSSIILNLSFSLFTITMCYIVYFMLYFTCVLYNSLLKVLWILDFK